MKNKLTAFLIVCAMGLGHASVPAQQPNLRKKVQDNALIDLSAALVNAAFTSNVDQQQKVNEVILGIPAYGTSRTTGKVTAVLVPDASNGVIDVFVQGTTLSDTVGVPPDLNLLIYTRTTLPFVLRKRIYVNESGLYAFPTQAKARADTKLIKVTNLKGQTGTLGTTIGEEGFEVAKRAYERAAAEKAEARLIQSFDEQFQPQLAQGNQALTSAVQKFRSEGVPLSGLHFSTTKTSLTVAAALTTTGQLPLWTPPPLGHFDLAGRIHQSAVNETAQGMFAGKTFNVKDLGNLPTNAAPTSMDAQVVQHCLGTMPKHLGVKAVYITFAERDPITAVFADQCVNITVRIQEIKAVGLRLPGVTIKTTYMMKNLPGRVELVRQGPVHVEPLVPGKIGSRALEVALQASLDQVFKSRVAVPPLTPPSSLSAVGTLTPADGNASNGWLVLTWVRPMKN